MKIPLGKDNTRIYLDYNATTPLLPAARKAMLAAMDCVGNPSSVHTEGRAARAIVETARTQIRAAFGVNDQDDIIFTASATEAAAMALSGRGYMASGIEHDAVAAWVSSHLSAKGGRVVVQAPQSGALQMANSETGIIQELPQGLGFSDMSQAFGKLPVSFENSGVQMACGSAHKLGGPKGVGCLIVKRGIEILSLVRGGGQEKGRRAGTENIIGIAGFGAAAEVAARDLADRRWAKIAKLRDILENRLAESQKSIILVGKELSRLSNTLCFSALGWKGETQVMQMDLAGFAISAGSACASGKVHRGKVLEAMGYSKDVAACAVRVSLGLESSEEDVMRFADAWFVAHDSFFARRTVG